MCMYVMLVITGESGMEICTFQCKCYVIVPCSEISYMTLSYKCSPRGIIGVALH